MSSSEGNALGEETKSFWGKISYENDKDKDITVDSAAESKGAAASSIDDSKTEKETTPERKRLQVEGSVIVGWGLEPEPVARFIMKEAEDDDEVIDNYDEDEDDGEGDEDDDDNVSDSSHDGEWSGGDVFQ